MNFIDYREWLRNNKRFWKEGIFRIKRRDGWWVITIQKARDEDYNAPTD